MGNMVTALRPTLPTSAGPAYRVLHGGQLLGFLSSQVGGIFESAQGAAEPGPPACQYRSLSPESETTMLELLHATTEFETLMEVLERAGLTLEETEAGGLFNPSPVVFRGTVPSSIVQEE